MFCQVTLIGFLGADPEIRTTTGGTVVGDLRVATTEREKDKSGAWTPVTEWHKVTVWAATAENCQRFLRKGSKIHVLGRLKTEKWQDSSGADRYTTKIIAQRVLFLDSKGDGGNTERRSDPNGYQGGGSRGGGGGYQAGGGGGGNQTPEDDIPFLADIGWSLPPDTQDDTIPIGIRS